MSNPKKGMHYEDVAKRVDRLTKSPTINPEIKGRQVESLMNQAERHQPGAKKELTKKMVRNNTNETWHDNYKSRPGGFTVGIEFSKCCKYRVEDNKCLKCGGTQ